MAAEVPAKDVLCEAMEYLSKLGSNLRTRSENLREKKIRREKLNNVLAVQKAASKVLLICELSKKSLENVENGVRKVLKLVDTSQAASSDGGKRNDKERDKSRTQKDNNPNYYSFKYKSRTLRIRNQISFKHYNSARVYAKSLPKSMMDNYPVHYDCKLYRIRKKQGLLQNEKEEARNKNVEDSYDMLVISTPDTPDSESTADKNPEKKNDKIINNNISIISIPDSPERVDIEISGKSTDKKSQRNSSVESTKERSTSRDRNKSPKEYKSVMHSSKERKSRSEKRKKEDESRVEEKKSSDSEVSRGEDKFKKRSKRKRVISASSSDAEKRASENNDSDAPNCESDSKKRKLNEDSSDEKKSDIDKKVSKDDTAIESPKPVIKCVSLSKLLKPDILVKEEMKRGPHSKPKDQLSERLSIQKEKKVRQYEKARQDKTSEKHIKNQEEGYWSQKRKEVSAFKPKSFDINVTRIPKFSLDYLKKLNLRKITQGGLTIFEISNEDVNGGENVDDEDEPTEKFKKRNSSKAKSIESNSRRASSNSSNDNALIDEANKVKNSLLNESDSDDAICSNNELESAKNNTEVIKNALLNDSDSDNKKSDNGSQSSGQNEKDKKIEENSDNVKSQLLGDSDSESENKKKNSVDGDRVSEPDSESEKKKKDSDVMVHDSESEKKDSEDNSQLSKLDSKSGNKKENSEDEAADPKKTPEIGSDKDNIGKGSPQNSNKIDSDEKSSSKENDENPSECQRNENEKTPEKKTASETDKAKSSDDCSDDHTKTPLSKRLTPQSKKKRMRESIQAKKMLLTYSSSDTEDELLSKALKEIKDSLLHGSDEDNKEKRKSKESSHSSSGEDIVQKVKKKKLHSESGVSKEKRNKHKKKNHRRKHDSDDASENSDNSKSSKSKMVRSKSKPGNSSCQSSDGPDSNDKDIDGLTNLKSLTKIRRRKSNSSEMSEESGVTTNTRSSSVKSKPTGLICDEMLKAESSSDSGEASAGETMDDEDLPTVSIPSFNGVGDHLEKEELLGDSDSSTSQNDDAQNDTKEETDSEDKPNARRRKPHAISSDSEIGSSRKKDADVKLSDFEDSDDSDVGNKRAKRKKKPVDSDASGGSGSSNEGGKKKRRRIKSVRDSDVSGSESETEGRNKHGRKNIRKVMGKNQLEEATKKAARQEKERMARIAERQKMYNNLQFDESGKPDEVVLDKVILDFDPETKEPLIEVDRGLVKKLKPHQANGIKFMWDACFESVKRIKKDRGSGCILAHCMGLGKTLQVVTLTHTLLTHGDLTKVNRVLVVCPLSTVLNWVNEFKMWLKYAETEFDVDVYELSRYKQNSERSFQLSQWFRHGGVCVLGYEMFRNLSADNSKKFKKKMLTNFQEALVDPGPDLVVCDEGHLLKNEKTSLSQSMNRVKTLRRIVLTGTPLQNNLKEYYCMVQFVKPNLLGKYNEYLNRFVNPITNGQYTDSTEHDIKIMKRRSHVLHKMLDGAVQRRDYGVLAPFLPPKHEYVLFITLSEVQTKLYQHYLDNFSRRPRPGKSSGFLFPDFQSLQRIWTHPLVLKYNSERYEIMQQKKRDKEEEEEDSEGSLRDFIDDESTSEESMSDDSTDDSSDISDDSRKKSKKKKKSSKKSKNKDKEGKGEGQSRPRRGTRANPVELDDDENKDDDVIELKQENPTEWWIKLVDDEVLEDMRNSHKLVLLFDILRQCEAIGDKLLVFSQSLYSLDLIEHFLGKVDDATQEGRIDEKLGGHIGTWSQGVDYFRLDGSTSCENRSIWCKHFNREDNPRARLFLISTRAGGLGINLVAANRVVIFDVSWNPSHDVQSIFRVYRFGQKKPCYVYRFLAMGTMEEKIYERQVTKQAISKRVIDEQQIDRHYAENDLAELYNFEPQPPTPRPIPPLPKDRLFAEMLREHEAQIYKYHEHDSLLENKEEETLSEEERKAAWEDFENEKNKPPPAPFPSAWQASMLQQQQLTYAALAAMLRKDMPNVSDNQLRDMIPVIYNANPQLMQKLSEIYKYSPAMLNPGMMNPGVMNPGMGGGMPVMGSGSGLQYEPPWQRQQQQQQQMRLQQLLQQQNPMGAKLYAGGLGSRDPVAMALQHQRAREIMMGGGVGAGAGAGAGRPRGRPPMQPRAPPAASGDVVNLDSD